MPFRDPVTSLPADAITGQINPGTQIAPGTLGAGILLPSAQLNGLVPTTQLSGQITTGQISANAVGTNQLAAGAVTAATISAGAIDGQTITGATIRTAASGNRVEITGTSVDLVDFYTGDANETSPGSVRGSTLHGGTSAADVLYTSIQSPTMAGGFAAISLHSTSRDGSTPPSVGIGNNLTVSGTVTVNNQDAFAAAVYTGTAVGQAGIGGAFAVNTVNVPSVPYPTLVRVTMTNFLTQTAATDTFQSSIRYAGTDYVAVRTTGTTAGVSTPSVTETFLIPANTATLFQTVVQRTAGGGTATSTANGTLNRLQASVTRAGA